MISDEPWMLDQVANEERLDMTFTELFSIDENSLPKNLEITHISLNDNTVEGLRCTNMPAFSVQFHPESSPGPYDSRYLFREFIDMMLEKVHA